MAERDVLKKIAVFMRRMNAFFWTPRNTMRDWEKCNDYSEIFYDPKTI
jgi:hypothetical protein